MNQTIRLASAVSETPSGRLGQYHPAVYTNAVYAVYTSREETLAAVRVAGGIAKAMGVPLTLVHFRTVPYPLPVNRPDGVSPIETDAFIARLHEEGLDTRVRLYLSRDAERAMLLAFKPHSLIVIAGQRSWWPKGSKRWRRKLEAAGHYVVFVDRENTHA